MSSDKKELTLNYDYLDRVRRMAVLATKRKTSDLLEGDFRSIQHGRSLEFDDLREYRYGDDAALIDWKSSSRAGTTLIRRYVAERRADVLFVGDTGLKMTGDTPDGESKEHLALMTFGIMAYLVGRQGANYALAYHKETEDYVSPFLTGAAHLEELLYGYKDAIEKGAAYENRVLHGKSAPYEAGLLHDRKASRKKNIIREKSEPYETDASQSKGNTEGGSALAELLTRTAANIPKRMIVIVLTDAEGLAAADERLLRRLTYRNDVCFIEFEDAYLTTSDAFDLGYGLYEDAYLTDSAELRHAEEQLRKGMKRDAEKLMTPNRVFFEEVSREDEIVDRVIRLFRRRREA